MAMRRPTPPLWELLSERESPSISERKRLFLSSLRGNSERGVKYRRYLGAPIRYPGGKTLGAGAF